VVPGHRKGCGKLSQEIRMFRHKRGNPETELGRTLNGANVHWKEDQVGYPARKGEGMPMAARESDQPIVL
jgi:hypothetical protein